MMTTLYAGAKANVNNVPSKASDEEKMQALVEAISSYIEYYHGGAVEMVGYSDNTLQVRLLGACEGCDLAPVTLHGWVEGTVRQFFPDLDRVEAVE
jgi:Fe-S cluster biogenesis protein NfuA